MARHPDTSTSQCEPFTLATWNARNLAPRFSEVAQLFSLFCLDIVVLHEIVLHNDDVNTFDHVIETLIRVCEHTAEQAEQCALLVHYKGKCTVKTGELTQLKPKCTALLEAGLSAELT